MWAYNDTDLETWYIFAFIDWINMTNIIYFGLLRGDILFITAFWKVLFWVAPNLLEPKTGNFCVQIYGVKQPGLMRMAKGMCFDPICCLFEMKIETCLISTSDWIISAYSFWFSPPTIWWLNDCTVYMNYYKLLPLTPFPHGLTS